VNLPVNKLCTPQSLQGHTEAVSTTRCNTGRNIVITRRFEDEAEGQDGRVVRRAPCSHKAQQRQGALDAALRGEISAGNPEHACFEIENDRNEIVSVTRHEPITRGRPVSAIGRVRVSDFDPS